MKPKSYLARALTGVAHISTKQLKQVGKLLGAALCLSVLTQLGHAQGVYSLSSLFTVATGVGNIANSSANRGMAYDSVSNLVYVANTAPSIGAFNGTNGTYLGAFNVTGVTVPTETLHLDQVSVAGDGAIYGINLEASSAHATQIYRWANWQSAPYVSFSGNPLVNGGSLPLTSGRVGDTMAVRGAGTNTLILTGVGGTNVFCLYYTTNGVDFTNTIINVPSFPFKGGINVYGMCFYTNNTFLVKSYSSTNSNVYVVQYPANFASQSLVTGVVLTNTALGGSYNNTTMLSYSAGLLGVMTMGGTTSPVGLFSATNIAGGTVNSLATASAATPNSNGNATGAVALGGTNVFYALDTANSLLAYSIVFSSAPVISSFTGGATNAFPPQTLTLSASGSAPLSYFWYKISGGVTNSFINNTNFYTVTTGGTNLFFVIVTNASGSITSSVVGTTLLFPVTNSAVTTLWQVAPGLAGYPFLAASGDNTRGLAYDTNSQRVVVSSSTGLYVLNGNNGTSIESMNLTGVTFGGSLGYCDQVGIADDGAVYAGNLALSGASFNLFRWSAPSNSVTATSAFAADPGNGAASGERWGDSIAVRGAGANTQILLGSRASSPNGTNIALLTPNDGQGLTYQSQIIAVKGVPSGFAGYGISFGAGNTFWAKNYNGDLYEIAYDPAALTGTVIFDYVHPSQIPNTLVGLGVDPVNNIMAGVQLSDNPNDLQLFQLTGTSDSPVLFDQAFFAAANVNGNDNAAVVVKYPRAYALDVNNGVVAVTYGVPSTTAPTINTPPASTTVYTNIPAVTLSVGASGSVPLHYQWRLNSNNIAGATSSSYIITNPPLSKAGYYDVVVHNIAGSVTSTPPALLTLLVPVSSTNVTQLWSISAGTNSSGSGSYLTTSGYETRGLAYDPTSFNLLVADHFNIHVYNATNGSYLNDLNTAGLPTAGINGWTLDQLGIAADGTLYSCNLSPDGTAFSIITFGAYPYQNLNYAYGSTAGGSDLKTLDSAGDRWGDTLAIRGSGVNTEILFGSYNGTVVALFTTQDGSSFTPQVITVAGVPAGFSGAGIAFGPGNTFFAKGGHNYNLREVSFDPVASTGTVIESYTAGVQVPNDLTGLGVDITNNILGGVCYNDSPHDVQLYLLSGNTNSPYLFDQDFIPAVNVNAQENSVVDLYGGLGFALDVNNGIVAFTYSAPTAPAVLLSSVGYAPGAVTLNWNNTFNNHSYQVQYKNHLLDPTWTNIGSPITASAESASYTDTSATGTTRFYRVISQ